MRTLEARYKNGGIRSLKNQSSRVANEVQELGRVAVAGVGRAGASLRDKSKDVMHAGVKKAKVAKGAFDDLVGEHPAKALLIALGTGLIVGFILRRRG